MPRMVKNRPTQKVVTTSLAGALATVLMPVLASFYGEPLPDSLAAAIVTLISFAIGWLTPPSIHDQVID